MTLWQAAARRWQQDTAQALQGMAQELDRVALALPDAESVTDLHAAAGRLRRLARTAGAR